MVNDIKQVNFGKLAAEREIDEGLKQYFLETGAFMRLREGSKSILLGNRGTGKSAIVKMLVDRYKQDNFLVVELTPEDYSYEMLQRSSIIDTDGKWIKASSYTAAWKYLLYVTAMKRYMTDSSTVVKSQAKNIYNYLRDNHKGHKADGSWDLFIGYLKRIESIKVGSYEVGLKTRELQELYKLEEINDLLQSLKMLTERKPIIFLIDELDKGWDASEDAQAFVSGLFQASITLNQLSKNFRVIVSLRRELYDNIPTLYEDYQKYNDIFEILEWNRDSLFKLITKRISFSFKKDKMTEREAWDRIFASKVEDKDSYEYIVERTLNRPRELIQFCIDAKQRAVEIVANKIDINAIVTSEVKYSDKRTKDIALEYKFQYPNLLNVFELFRGKNCLITRVELEELFYKVVIGEIKVKDCDSWLLNQNEEYLINVLWQVGFLKIYTTTYLEGKHAADYFGIHEINQSNIGAIEKFMIHPMFRMYLGVTGNNC